MNRRGFLEKLGALLLSLTGAGRLLRPGIARGSADRPNGKLYGMGVQVDKCIGCAKCMEACKIENNVPREPFFFRTWVEKYAIRDGAEVEIQTIGTGKIARAHEDGVDKDVIRSFFVPKLCNQCAHPPCVQVCPVRATFSTDDGVVLVDGDRCIGCRYCIQACPYGARYLHPDTHTADKCTFCYHRVSRGLLPACVEVCPTQARIFGNARSVASPLMRLKRMTKVHVLKGHLNTEPKVFYANLDGEVK